MTDFHNESMRLATQRVLDRARINKRKKMYHNLGGYANQRQRLRPTTTAQMPLYMNGNNTYPTQDNNLTGGFRTQAGQSYGMDLLQRRAKQLELMAMTDEEKQLLPKEQPIPLSEISEDKVAFDLLLSEIENFVDTGNILQIRVQDVRKLFALFRKFMYDIGVQELTTYYSLITDLTGEIINMFQGFTAQDARSMAVYNVLIRLRSLIKVMIASVNKDPKQRKTFVNQFIKTISTITSADRIDKMVDDALEKVEAFKPFVFEEPQRRIPQPTEMDDAEAFIRELDEADGRETGFFGDEDDSVEEGEIVGQGAWADGYSRMERLSGMV